MPATPRTLSVYGGAGGRGTRISSSSGFPFSSPRGYNSGDAVDVTADEKAAMQNLNSRLALYLTTVRSLEMTNAELDKKIREWCESHTHSSSDHSNYLATINNLKEQFNLVSKDNARIILAVDNARLAAEDFKMKYEYELLMKKDIETDVAGLRKVLDNYTFDRSNLESKYEGHKEDLAFLNKKHEEDVAFFRDDAAGKLDVSVDAAPSMDLQKAITGSDEDFDAAAEKYITELEDWYKNRGKKPQTEDITPSEDLQTNIKLLRELKCKFQKLEIDLRFQHKMRIVDTGTLEERNAQYWSQLTKLQAHVTSLEDQLSFFHCKYAKNKQQYDALLDIKTQLEQEIKEYKRIQEQLFVEESDKHKAVENDNKAEPPVDASAVENDKKAKPTVDASAVENDKKAKPTVDASAAENDNKAEPTVDASAVENDKKAKPTVDASAAENDNKAEPTVDASAAEKSTKAEPPMDASAAENDKKAKPTVDASAAEKSTKAEPTVDASAVKSSEKVDDKEKINKSG